VDIRETDGGSPILFLLDQMHPLTRRKDKTAMRLDATLLLGHCSPAEC
jgi:hypothetical protein